MSDYNNMNENANSKKNNNPYMKDFKITNRDVSKWLRQYPVLSQEDFCPPEDRRVLHSGINSISGGDTFMKYIEEYYALIAEEEIYDC